VTQVDAVFHQRVTLERVQLQSGFSDKLMKIQGAKTPPKALKTLVEAVLTCSAQKSIAVP
jgi:hypothetical protein